MIRNNNIPWSDIISILKGEGTGDSNIRLEKWLAHNKSNHEIFNELSVLWESIRQEENFTPDVNSAWAEVKAKTVLKHKKRHRKDRTTIKRIAISLGSIAACTLLFFLGIISIHKNDSYLKIDEYSVNNGISNIILSDATEIHIRNGSSISLANNNRKGDRTVVLNGEAFFHVAKNEGKPFVVKTGDIDILVYGTKFNVRSEAYSKDIIVSLLEGEISLKSENRISEIKPGYIARCKKNGDIILTKGDVNNEKCWIDGILCFKSMNLGSVCKYLSRWYNVNIDIDPAIGDQYQYNFTISHESLEEVISMMSMVSPINYSFNQDGSLIINSIKK